MLSFARQHHCLLLFIHLCCCSQGNTSVCCCSQGNTSACCCSQGNTSLCLFFSQGNASVCCCSQGNTSVVVRKATPLFVVVRKPTPLFIVRKATPLFGYNITVEPCNKQKYLYKYGPRHPCLLLFARQHLCLLFARPHLSLLLFARQHLYCCSPGTPLEFAVVRS